MSKTEMTAADSSGSEGRVNTETRSGPLQARRALSIVLIRPSSVLPLRALTATYEMPPLGLAYLAAALGKAGHRVRIIDAFGEHPDQVNRSDWYQTRGLTLEQITDRVPHDVDLIGVACMFSNSWLHARQAIVQLAAAFPGVPIVAGGEHVTADYDRLLRRVPEVQCCVLGEGEDTIVDIAAHLSHALSLDTVPGIALRNAEGAVVTTEKRRRIIEVDDIPWPDWSSVPLSSYLDNGITADAYEGRCMPMLASRGCPFQCTFCSSPQMFGTKWVARDPRHVVAEMRHYVETYNARYFEFHDLTAIVRRDWILEFCRILVDERLDVEWSIPAGTRTEALDGEVLGWMRRSGCRSFAYAAESGSVDELKRIKKGVKLPRMLASMREAVKQGMVTQCHLIIGMPDQTSGDVLHTLAFVTRVAIAGVHDIGCYSFSPYPGSALYQRLVAEGQIDPEAEDYDQQLAHNVYTDYVAQRSWTPHLPAWSLLWICIGLMVYFHTLQIVLRPQRGVALLRNVIGNRPRTRLQRVLTRKLGLKAIQPTVTVPAPAHSPLTR